MKTVYFFGRQWVKSCLLVFASSTLILLANGQSTNALTVLKSIGDKLIRETPFKYQLSLHHANKTFNGLQVVDFGRTFGLGKPGVAYAVTQLESNTNQDFNIELEHNDGCKIWLNGKLVYQFSGNRKLQMVFAERSIKMQKKLVLPLQKGINQLLIKSETSGKEWKVCMQPPSTNGAVLAKAIDYPAIGVDKMQYIDASIAKVSNWLVVGPFANVNRTGLNTVYEPEKAIAFGTMYAGANEPITWTIPKIEIVGGMINPKKWGTSYHWNYHNGGTAWAMQILSEISGDKKYDDFANNYCNFHLNGTPFVRHQLYNLNADSSANIQILGVPLLDFTLAPSLPLVHRLHKEPNFTNRKLYQSFIDRMVQYGTKEQLRLANSNIFTRLTPQKYTTWVDDMFMGIPFLVQASRIAKTDAERARLLDDAANQVLNFKSEVWDSAANLYCHAKYSGSSAKLPHWSRANGWGIWATTEVLKQLPRSHPLYAKILAHYQTHVASIIKYQDESGFWFNVIDRKDSKKEVSGTAIFTMAIARGINNGWLDAATYTPKVKRAWSALQSRIEADGTVHDICMGTMCSEDVNYYINRPYFDDDTHGLFAVLFAGIEMHLLTNNQKTTFQY